MKAMINTFMMALVAVMIFAGLALAGPGKPNFSPVIYGDGEPWGTKVTTTLKEPNEHNMQSYDGLFVITNSNNPMGQLPVAEAAPGSRYYNGGRWITHTAEWTEAGFNDHGIVPVLKSYDELMLHYGLGHIEIWPGSPPGGPPLYFSCPLLPVK